MDLNLAQNWPVYLLGGAFIIFVICAVISGKSANKKN